jgi:predicted ribosomally synthesized peptide with nif11-like leader
MSIQDAMKFIQRVGNDEKLKDKIRGLGDSDDLEDIKRIGVEEGFNFSIEELRIAFAKDWAIRRNFYSSKASK